MLIEKVKTYCKEHKTEILIFGGVSIALLGSAVLGIRLHNESVVEQAMKEAASLSVSHDFSNTIPFEVKSHVRKLPEGMQASPMKELTALEHGYNLNPGETWVESYLKCKAA